MSSNTNLTPANTTEKAAVQAQNVAINESVSSTCSSLIKDAEFKYRGTYPDDVFIASKDRNDFKATFHYEDSYFLQDSSIYNNQLATMSLCLELSAWTSYLADCDKGGWAQSAATHNAFNLLTAINFEHFDYSNDIKSPPTADSIGAIAASKPIYVNKDEYTLIAVAIRGGGYFSEWASNFTIGSSGTHDGFSTAKNKVLEFLLDYIKGVNIKGKIKLWLVGYSRAGAVATLLASVLNGDDDPRVWDIHNQRRYSTIRASLQQRDLFAYTFEAPQGGMKLQNKDSNNIHNIVNPNDFVPLVAPSDWDFIRYGSKKSIPNYSKPYSKPSEDKMRKQFDYIMKVNLANHGIKTINYIVTYQKEILNKAIAAFVKSIGKREDYVKNYQDGVRILLTRFFSYNNESNYLKKLPKKFLSTLTVQDYAKIGAAAAEVVTPGTTIVAVNTAYQTLKEKLVAFLKEEKVDVSSSFVDKITLLLIKFICHDIKNFSRIVDCVKSGSFGQAHEPEVCFAWLRSEDKNYEYAYHTVYMGARH